VLPVQALRCFGSLAYAFRRPQLLISVRLALLLSFHTRRLGDGEAAASCEVVGVVAASGLGVRAFCQREGFSETNFHAWRRELRLRDREVVAVIEQRRPAFVPAVITTEKRDDAAVLLTVALDGT
jgi:hypothetical protein